MPPLFSFLHQVAAINGNVWLSWFLHLFILPTQHFSFCPSSWIWLFEILRKTHTLKPFKQINDQSSATWSHKATARSWGHHVRQRCTALELCQSRSPSHLPRALHSSKHIYTDLRGKQAYQDCHKGLNACRWILNKITNTHISDSCIEERTLNFDSYSSDTIYELNNLMKSVSVLSIKWGFYTYLSRLL